MDTANTTVRLDGAVRGSARLFDAWKARERQVVTDDDVAQLARVLEDSPARVAHVVVAGGREATGVGVALQYDGDDVPLCGNDLARLLELLHRLGTPSEPPVVIVNGKPRVDRALILATLGVLPANAFDAVIPHGPAQRVSVR